ncbi:hypothetical protein ADIARSV_3805 [Arcticibacter svalbardensis MN12-7]|uniref:Uncharacterized protein n=1 Tax=Arcticibacter svalbardensis MN12-7 TaxID=1150600 RepID=R9GN86_9SPHI|nr:hypothetical protein ADIARSV_3805 [Arcticibacter svalbardensis MN12-7]
MGHFNEDVLKLTNFQSKHPSVIQLTSKVEKKLADNGVLV